jgi:hypothetical protein
MTNKTRYFVITSLLVLMVGLGTGLVAFYVGLPGGLGLGADGPDELRYVPRNASVVAYADVHEIMTSDIRQRIRQAVPVPENGQRQFQEQTGIDIESDIDRVVASLQPTPDGKTAGLVLARGRFSDVKIEALMREHGAEVVDYNGKRLIEHAAGSSVPRQVGDSVALAFLEPGLVAVGTGRMVRTAIDLRNSGENVTGNAELMSLVKSLESGNAWAVGRLDVLMADGRFPAQLTSRLPPITWFSVSGRVDTEIRGVVRADARDEEAANDLRDVIRGFLALGKLQAGSRPELQTMIQSLELGGTGKSVALSFAIPGELFDMIHSTIAPHVPPQQ